MVDWTFPEKMGFLFEPHRWKVAYGGRDGGKSWSFARALLLLGANQPLRIGCFRETHRSIRDSVHRLLGDQIEAMGLSSQYEVLDQEIRGRVEHEVIGPTGEKMKRRTQFIFAGLSAETRESIKSYESVNIAWVEEAQSVKERS